MSYYKQNIVIAQTQYQHVTIKIYTHNQQSDETSKSCTQDLCTLLYDKQIKIY